ncbi:MAG: glutamine amidotransferase [Actinomycetaceae bacterium]|nr:glutamine amidotransferase [Actinomycetaceae bacterium]
MTISSTPMKPFLFAVCRPEGAIALDEWQSFATFGGLDPQQDIVRVSMVDATAPNPTDLDLSGEYSGVVITGSPFGYSEVGAHGIPTVLEDRAEQLAQRVIAEDIPTLAICFGLQAITRTLGGTLVGGFAEDLQAPAITLTEAALSDPLTRHLEPVIYGYTGHSDAIGVLPGDATVLATGEFCQIQMVRWGRNVYGTQFHPEIEKEGMRIRINTYSDTYYPADEKEAVIARCDAADTTGANQIISAFVARYWKART